MKKYLILSLVLALGVILWFSSVSFISSFIQIDTENSISLESIDCSSTNNLNSPICIEKKRALEEKSKLVALLQEVNSSSYITKNDVYKEIIAAQKQGDIFFEEKYFGQSYTTYYTAKSELEVLIKESEIKLKDLLKEGKSALDKGDWEQSLKNFNSALEIDNKNPEAKEGLERSLKQEEVIELTKEIQIFLSAQEIESAQDILSQALLLDKKNKRLLELKEDIDVLFKERDLNNYLNQAYKLINQSRYRESLSYFNKALTIDPNNSEALKGKSEAGERLEEKQIESKISEAEKLFQDENFKESLQLFEEVLNQNKNLAIAQLGYQLSKEYIAIEQRLDMYLSKPERLQSTAVFDEVSEFFKEIQNLQLEERLMSKKDSLDKIYESNSLWIEINLFSDNKTNLSIQNGAKLGKFKVKKLRVRKGKYVFIGQRIGYVSVRKELEIDGPISLTLLCLDKI